MPKELVINGDEIKTNDDFHRQIKELLSFPSYYGNNLDALWDCLTTSIELPLTLVWKDLEKSKMELGDYCDKILDVFKHAEKEIPGFKIICS